MTLIYTDWDFCKKIMTVLIVLYRYNKLNSNHTMYGWQNALSISRCGDHSLISLYVEEWVGANIPSPASCESGEANSLLPSPLPGSYAHAATLTPQINDRSTSPFFHRVNRARIYRLGPWLGFDCDSRTLSKRRTWKVQDILLLNMEHVSTNYASQLQGSKLKMFIN